MCFNVLSPRILSDFCLFAPIFSFFYLVFIFVIQYLFLFGEVFEMFVFVLSDSRDVVSMSTKDIFILMGTLTSLSLVVTKTQMIT